MQPLSHFSWSRMPQKCDVRQCSPIYSEQRCFQMPYTVEQAKSTIPHVTDEHVSITRRDNQLTEKCDATLTFVPKSRQMKAPRTLPEAESVFLLSSPNTVLKIYHSYISCPELTSETNSLPRRKRTILDKKKSNEVLIKHVQCNSTSHQHLNIRSYKNTINISYKQRKSGLIERADWLGVSFIFYFTEIKFNLSLLHSQVGNKRRCGGFGSEEVRKRHIWLALSTLLAASLSFANIS